jgi:hypothetical protein
MIKDKKIFDAMTMTLDGDKVRVLTTPHHITKNEIPDVLKVYTLMSTKKENHYMVDEMESTNTADFAMSMISHTPVPLGSDIELKDCDTLYGPMAKMSIEEYFIETVGIIKLYVMMAEDGVSPDEVIKRLAAARRCFAIACGRNIDDVEILNNVDEIDPYDIDVNFENEVDRSIYRLTKRIRTLSKATHILDMSSSFGFVLRNPCSVERELCEKYHLNRIDVSLLYSVVRRIQKENNDLDTIMGKTAVVGNPRIPRYLNDPTPYRIGDYDGDPLL